MVIYLTIPIIMTIIMTLYKYGMVIYLKIPIIMNIPISMFCFDGNPNVGLQQLLADLQI